MNNDSPMFKTLRQVEETLNTYYEIQDWQGIRIILAITLAHYIPGEPLWVRIIGASRSGKTELLRAILSHESDATELEAMTPASIRGGLKDGKKVLERLHGKLVITKDLATLVTMRKDARQEILGLLRSVKDGQLSSDFGNEIGHISQNAKFDWIIATTPIIEGSRQIESLLGERYVDLRWIPGNREEMAFRAANNNPNLTTIRSLIAEQVRSLMDRAREMMTSGGIKLNESETRYVAKLADAVALCRSQLHKDNENHLLAIPQPEIGTSLAQDLSRIALGLGLLGIEDYQLYIDRLAWDCIPSVRATIIRTIKSGHVSAYDLLEYSRLPKSTLYFHLNDLKSLNIVSGNDVINYKVEVALP